MDYATRLAFRAVVSGLHHAGTIDQRHVSKIIEALNDAIDKADADHERGATHELEVLRDQIARDGQVSPGRE